MVFLLLRIVSLHWQTGVTEASCNPKFSSYRSGRSCRQQHVYLVLPHWILYEGWIVVEIVRVDATVYQNFAEVLTLLQNAFEYMHGRIDPPSSLHRFDAEKLKLKAINETMFIAQDKELPVGCVFAQVKEDHVYLGKLAVRSDYRGRGLSRMLVSRVESLARQLGLLEVEIETRIELTENQALFEYFGYLRTAENSHPGYNRPTSVCYRKKV